MRHPSNEDLLDAINETIMHVKVLNQKIDLMLNVDPESPEVISSSAAQELIDIMNGMGLPGSRLAELAKDWLGEDSLDDREEGAKAYESYIESLEIERDVFKADLVRASDRIAELEDTLDSIRSSGKGGFHKDDVEVVMRELEWAIRVQDDLNANSFDSSDDRIGAYYEWSSKTAPKALTAFARIVAHERELMELVKAGIADLESTVEQYKAGVDTIRHQRDLHAAREKNLTAALRPFVVSGLANWGDRPVEPDGFVYITVRLSDIGRARAALSPGGGGD